MFARKPAFAFSRLRRITLPIAAAALAFVLVAVRPPDAQAYALFGFMWNGAVALDASGNLEVFVPSLFGSVMRKVQDPSSPSGWSAWEALPGVTVGGPNSIVIGTHPVPGVSQGGLLDVFVRSSDGSLWHRLQQKDGSFSAPWEHLSAIAANPGTGGYLTDTLVAPPAVVTNADGALEVFGFSAPFWYSYYLLHNWQLSPTSPDAWSGWQACYTGPCTGATAAGAGAGSNIVAALNTTGPLNGTITLSRSGFPISIATNADGCLEVYSVGTGPGENNPLIWTTSQSHYYCGSTHWTSAQFLPPLAAGQTGPVAVARDASGMLEVFVLSGDLAIWNISQTGIFYDRTQYGNWQSLGVPGPGAAGTPFVAANRYGRLDVFVVASDSSVYHNVQVPACGIHLATIKCGGWSGWLKLQ